MCSPLFSAPPSHNQLWCRKPPIYKTTAVCSVPTKMLNFSATQLNLADLHLQLYLLHIHIVQECCLNITSDIDQPPSTQCEIVTLVFEEELTKTQQINVCQLTPSCFPYCQQATGKFEWNIRNCTNGFNSEAYFHLQNCTHGMKLPSHRKGARSVPVSIH